MSKYEYKIEKGYGVILTQETLNKLGGEGWELCSIGVQKDENYINGVVNWYYFKRMCE